MVSEFYRELQSPEGLKSIHLCSKQLAFVCCVFFSLHRTQKINSVNKRHQFSLNRGRKFDNWPRYIVHQCPKILQKYANILKSTGDAGRWDWEAAKRLQPTPCGRQRIQRTGRRQFEEEKFNAFFNAIS